MEPNILDDNFDQQETPGPEHAGFSIRLGAAVLDSLILLPLAALNIWNMLGLKSLLLMVLLSFLTMLYKPMYEYLYSATIGKRTVGIKVLTESYDRMTLDQSFLRSAPWIISGLLGVSTNVAIFQAEKFADTTSFEELVVLMNQYAGMGDQLASWMLVISCLFVLFNQKKQALHDQLAKTYCVYGK